MSFIANILSQIKQPSKKKEVHPQLEHMLKQKDKKKSGRKKYVILSVIALIYIFSTIFFTLFFRQEVQNVKEAISMIKSQYSKSSLANLSGMGMKQDTSSPEGMGMKQDASSSKSMEDIDKNIENTVSSIQDQYTFLLSQIQKNSSGSKKPSEAVENNLDNNVSHQYSNPLPQIQEGSSSSQDKSKALGNNLKDVLSVVSATEKNPSVDTKDIKKDVSNAMTQKDDVLTNMPQTKPSNRVRHKPKNYKMQEAQNYIAQNENEINEDDDEDYREIKVKVKKDGDRNPESIDTIPTISGRHLYAGLNHEKNGEYHDAFNEYKLESVTDGVSYRLLNRMAFLLIKTHRYTEAIDYAIMAITIKKDYTPAIINLAIAYAKTNRIDLALETFQNGLNASPYDSELLYNFAVFNEKNNRLDSAHDLYSRLVEIGDKRGEVGLKRVELLTGAQSSIKVSDK